ncbi:MAG: prepilin-type N-terminal cleavage/methylation domain-containing protein [Verrucomicrobia bacterium]|nr:prepilin-type N-terminal cleavage/methylation domain-containing protein [Verrucomicrobiota bacterium]
MTRPPRQVRASIRGLTLIELLVALTILAILLSSVYGTFISAMNAIRRARTDDGIYQVARTVMDRISMDLEMTYYQPGPDRPGQPTQLFIGLDRSEGDYARDRLDFLAACHILARDGRPETDVVEISYYIDDTLYDRPLLVRREDPLPDFDLRHGGTLRVLAENVVSLNFRYRERSPEPNTRSRPADAAARAEEAQKAEQELEWFDAWNADTNENPSKSLPELVEVTFVLRDKDGAEYTFSTTVQLHPYYSWQ